MPSTTIGSAFDRKTGARFHVYYAGANERSLRIVGPVHTDGRVRRSPEVHVRGAPGGVAQAVQFAREWCQASGLDLEVVGATEPPR